MKGVKKEDQEDPPDEPARYVINDTTIPKLEEILARSPRGSLFEIDEAVGWILGLERWNHGADRARALQLWNGGAHDTDRIARDNTHVENFSASILGGAQPDRLAEIDGLQSDGLLQRFLPCLMRDPTYGADIDWRAERNAYEDLIDRLIALEPRTFALTPVGYEIMSDLSRHLNALASAGKAISKGFQGYVGKLEAYSGVFATVLHLIEHPDPTAIDRTHIAGNVAENVDRLVRGFFIPHGRKLYGQGEDAEDTQRAASYILTSGLARVRVSDIKKNIWGMKNTGVREINDILSPLVAGGWLAPEDSKTGPYRHAWKVNRDAIDAQFAEQRQIEEERKAALKALIFDAAETNRDSEEIS
jgi:hypothetical protein